MLKSHLAACLTATALLGAPAWAQTNQQAPASNAPAGQNTTMTKPASPATGAPAGQTETILLQPQAAAPATSVQGGDVRYITQNRPDLWRASKLEGVNIYNDQNEKVGDIREVLVNEQGQVEAVVIGVGGFLGIGERDVAVPFNALQWVQEPRTAAAAPPGAPGAAPGTAATAPVTPAPRDAAAPPPAASGSRMATAPAERDDAAMTTGTVDGRLADTRYDRGRDYPERAILAGATKDQLKDAPEFKYSR